MLLALAHIATWLVLTFVGNCFRSLFWYVLVRAFRKHYLADHSPQKQTFYVWWLDNILWWRKITLFITTGSFALCFGLFTGHCLRLIVTCTRSVLHACRASHSAAVPGKPLGFLSCSCPAATLSVVLALPAQCICPYQESAATNAKYKLPVAQLNATGTYNSTCMLLVFPVPNFSCLNRCLVSLDE